MEFRIREAMAADGKTIADYNSRLAAETEGGALDADVVNAGVSALLADPQKGRYWVAESPAGIIGQIMVTHEWSDWRNGLIWWVQSVYVREDHRRDGVFSALYGHVQALARSDPQVAGIRLYVEKDNERAMATYGKLGMSRTDYRVMQVLWTPGEARKGDR